MEESPPTNAAGQQVHACKTWTVDGSAQRLPESPDKAGPLSSHTSAGGGMRKGIKTAELCNPRNEGGMSSSPCGGPTSS